jgi:hypothetical protein
MCIDCRLDLWRGSEGVGSGQRARLAELGRPPVASADRICPLENVLDERRGCTAPVAWRGQARPSQFRSASQNSAFHHEVLAIAGFLSGLRGKISITSMRPW